MNIQETIISRTYENKFGEFFITLKIKPEDISLEEREACRAACREGTLMEGMLQRFQIEEKSLLRDSAKPKEETIYKKFKRVCLDYSGEDYYNRLKQHLGIKHLKDLEQKQSESMIEDLLKCQSSYIFWRKQGYGHSAANFSVGNPDFLTHKDNALSLWNHIFDSFNNPENEKN